MADNCFFDPRPDMAGTRVVGYLALFAAAGLACAGYRVAAGGACAVALIMFGRLSLRLHAALTDPVTGLPTRVTAERYLNLANGTQHSLAVTDLKDLRGFNASYGHPAGDQALAHFARALWRMRVPGDLIARLGGDEFLIITSRAPDILRRDLAEALRQPVVIGGRPVRLRASTGVCPIAGGDARAALATADVRLREAKTHPDTTTIADAAELSQQQRPSAL
jgi:diguanylate cyclase (GGDEF)-like protein